ncbi:MAG: ABC transporter permease [Ruminococcaceae bacterium]|nr:ABC transporter permease [Oscillospiraceae bacterium]
MTGLGNLIERNTKMYFKDKGIFFTSLITPLILLVLYATFLANVYKDSFMSAIPEFIKVSDELVDAMVSGQLFSSLLAVCTITVAFCSNMLMVQDKVTGAKKDLCVTPVKKSTLALSYYIATFISTMIICLVATLACLIYIYNTGWYMTVSDVGYILLDVFLLVMFGTALSSIINMFLSSQGQISAVGSIVSSCYGFICGAYMPIASFSKGLQKVLSFLPGTYGTSILRNHALRGVFEEMSSIGFPKEVVTGLRDAVDCNIYFFGDKVEISSMYIYLASAVVILVAVYVILNMVMKNKAK